MSIYGYALIKTKTIRSKFYSKKGKIKQKKKTNQQKKVWVLGAEKSDCESKWVAKQAAWLACRMCLYLCTFVFFLHPFVMCSNYLPSAINKLAAHWVYISYLIAYVWFHFKRDFVEFRIVRSKGIGYNNWVYVCECFTPDINSYGS